MSLRSCLGGEIGSSLIDMRQRRRQESSRLLRLLLLLLRLLVQCNRVCMRGKMGLKTSTVPVATLHKMTHKSRQVSVALTAKLTTVDTAAVVAEKLAYRPLKPRLRRRKRTRLWRTMSTRHVPCHRRRKDHPSTMAACDTEKSAAV
jgi:hypothetical protein